MNASNPRAAPAEPQHLEIPGMDESGQGLAEYALILLLVAVAVVGALQALAPPISDAIQSVVPFLGGG